eukprot:TRINITY_DN10098_c0_g1_i1.p1 TRINITY_DN10098_c0_g1~~TRINITY_DN10098_c0_g1_i1.p1  ORF type:complete len:639 (-),score=157.35 TRINITY_DN10098_c0_g1_i1:137-1960(-)
MSDEEMLMSNAETLPKGHDGDEQMDSDDEMDGMDDVDCTGAHEFPDGISKEIITKAQLNTWKKPKDGDEVTVHYVGTLESDGSEFDSSRARGKPFAFTLGRGDVIKGWDLGVASMCKGEVAKFTLCPEFAYGDSGSPPKIPEKATLVFEIELIDWVSKDDVFGDGGVIKTTLKEGDGSKTPKIGDEVNMTLKVETLDGVILEERSNFDYTIGSDVLGSIGRACDTALTGMDRGERASLACTKEYSFGDKHPNGVTVTLTLFEIYETTDVSFAKDNSVMKKQVKQGEGYDKPKEGAKIKLLVEAVTDGQEPLPGFSPKTLEFISMFGEVCDALESAVAGMKKSERALVTVFQPQDAAEEKLGIGQLTSAKLVFTLELVDFEKAADIWEMSKEEKIAFATSRKEVGTKMFQKGRTRMALRCYDNASDVLGGADDEPGDSDKTTKDLKKICELNKAACFIKLQEFHDAKNSCDAVLKEEPQNVKAVHRQAQANFGLKDFLDCIRDCKRVVELDPQNREARSLFRKARLCQQEEDQKAKGFYANMCQALGRLPTPQPASRKRSHEDANEEDGSEDTDAGVADGNAEKRSTKAEDKVAADGTDTGSGATTKE